MIYRTYYLSPLGRILLAADDIGLIGVWFEGQKYFGEFPGHMNYIFEEKENHILKDALRWLDIYFSGQKPDFLPKLHLIGTDFHSPANKDRELFQAFGRTVQIQITVIPYPTYAQFKPLPSYRFKNGWNGKGKSKSLIELCLFTF